MTVLKKIAFVSLAVFFLAAFVLAAIFLGNVSARLEIPPAARSLTISPGETVKEISRRLRRKNLIRSDFWFRTYVWLRGKESNFIAGNFSLPERVNMIELLEWLTNRAGQNVRTVKILEGWGIRDLALYFEGMGMFVQGEIIETAGAPSVEKNDFSSRFPFLKAKPAQYGLEGFLFPDTYEVFANAAVREVIEKMLANFENKVSPDLLAEIERQGKNLYDVLIMASIVEAEVPHSQDRPIVAGIFWSRLEKAVPLQSDATLNYAIGGHNARLTAEQLKIDSPYNTYVYGGLPPTPIGNPGLDAIKAAIYPQKTDYFFFLSTPEGETIFSRTLSEHNAAKAKYFK